MGTERLDGYSGYLSAKRTVDDRSINRHVLDRLSIELEKVQGRPLHIVEIGAGLGTMVARMVDLKMVTQAEYLLLDVNPSLLREARSWLAGWADSRRLTAIGVDESLKIRGKAGVELTIRFVACELGDFVARTPPPTRADLLIASAFLDLVDVARLLPRMFTLIVPDGLYFFAVNFDGETIFEPEHPDDAPLLRAYHRSMDQRIRYGRQAGDSHCGRHLFGHLRTAGASILAAGASDWVVHPQGAGYIDEEAHFLRSIVATIGDELRRQPDVSTEILDNWLANRRQQIDRAELVYIAHQLDFVGRRGPE